MPPQLSDAIRAVADVLLPRRCVACGSPPEVGPFCSECLPLMLPVDPEPAPRPLDAWEAAVPYRGEWRDWIRRFKFPRSGLLGLDPAADAVVVWLACRAADQVPAALRPDVIVPVPLHPRRLRERGFNQASLMARAVSKRTPGVPVQALLKRSLDTQRQTELSRSERRRNLRGAFRAERPVAPCVWLVDDVTTTGSTLAEAARTLRSAGAKTVVGICAARTPIGLPDDDV